MSLIAIPETVHTYAIGENEVDICICISRLKL